MANKTLRELFEEFEKEKDPKEYGVHSVFNIKKHAKTFINYLEVIIYSNGKVEYACPSHQMKLENILKDKVGIEKFNQLIELPEAYEDYMVFLCTKTNCCSVWNDFYICGKNGLTEKQKEMLIKLKSTMYEKIDTPLYQGEIKC